MNAYLAVLRYLATALLAGLTAALTYYPHNIYLAIGIATLGTLGIHVVPTAIQSRSTKSDNSSV